MDVDDIIEAWCAGYEAAWKGPGPTPNIGFNKMKYYQDRLEIVQLSNMAAPPFHRGFKIGDTKSTRGADAAAIILDVLTGNKLANDSRAKRDDIVSLCETSGMSINRWHVCDACRDGTAMRATIYLEIEALNAAGTRQSHDFLVGEGWGLRGRDKIRRLADTQKARQAIAEAPLTIDPILLRALHRLPPKELERLEAHLRRHPTVPTEDRGMAMQANWNRSSLARHGCRLPEGVETVVVKKGVVSGRVRLAPGTTWYAGTLVHAAGMPDTLTVGLVGLRLADLVEHPDIDPRLVVKTAVISKRRALRVTTEPLLEALGARRGP